MFPTFLCVSSRHPLLLTYVPNFCCLTYSFTCSHCPGPPTPVRWCSIYCMPAPPVAPSPIIPTASHPLMPVAYGSCCAAGLLTADISASGDFTASLPPVPPQIVIRIRLPLLLVDCCFESQKSSSPPIASVSLSPSGPPSLPPSAPLSLPLVVPPPLVLVCPG